MENPLRKQIRSIMKDHKKRQMWYRIVTTLAVVVVFVTTYMLILPAITMENKAECGITEHKHDANCYSSHYEKEKELACTTDSLGVHKHTDACYDAEHKLICGYADFVIHEHDASCYDKDGNLVCTIPEHKLHQHTPECYQMQKQLVCTQEESVGHTHTPECYTKQQGALICGKEEHTHGEGCYDADGNLICTLEEHTHSDECYEWNDVLTCTIPESAGHTHSEACYQNVQVLICEEPAELHTHTAECYKDGVLACGKLELKEHKHSETCFTEKQVLVETLICDRVEHVHTDECYKKSTEETATSEAVTTSQNEETSSEDESSETASIEETSSEETSTEEASTEEASSEADTDAEEPSTEASSEETSLEEASTEETSLEASSEDESEVESETETAEEVESESEIESESESETEESSSIEAETEEESSEEVSTEEESSEEESFEETSTEETSEEELTSEEASTEEETSEAEEESSEEETSEADDFIDQWELGENGALFIAYTSDDDVMGLEDADLLSIASLDEEINEDRPMLYRVAARAANTAPTGTEFKNYITSATVQKIVNGEWQPAKEFENDDNVKVELKYILPDGTVTPNNKSIWYQLPNGVVPNDDLKGIVYNKSNNPIGTYEIGKDGLIQIDFYEEFATGKEITGDIFFSGKVESSNTKEDQKIEFGGSSKSITIKKETEEEAKTDIAIKKEGKLSDSKDKITYTVTVSSTLGTGEQVNVYDYLTNGTYEGTVKVTKSGNEIQKDQYQFSIKNNETKSEMKIENLPELQAGESYVITYEAKPGKRSANGELNVDNSVSTNKGKNDYCSIKVNKAFISKSGEHKSDKNVIEWTITIDPDGTDLNGYTLSDKLDGKDLSGKKATLTYSDGTTEEITLPYTFRESTNGKVSCKIVYQTDIESDQPSGNVKNDVTIEKGGDKYEAGTTVGYTRRDWDLIKYKDKEEKVKGKDKMKYTWKSTITLPDKNLSNLGAFTYEDTIGEPSIHSASKTELDKQIKDNIEFEYLDENGTLMKVTGSQVNTYFDYQITYTPEDADSVSGFNIVFTPKPNLQIKGKQIVLSYATNADTSSVPSGGTTTFTNKAKVNGIEKHASVNYKKPVKIQKASSAEGALKPPKNNLWWETDYVYKGYANSKAEVKLGEDGYLYYRLILNLEEAQDVNLSDSLPIGTTYVEGSAFAAYCSLAEDGTITAIAYTSNPIKTEASIDTVSSADGKYQELKLTLSNIIQTSIEEGFLYKKNEFKGNIAVYYTVKVDDSVFNAKGTASLKNTAKWEKEKEFAENTTNVKRFEKIVDKSGKQVFDDQNKPVDAVKYRVVINPEASDLDVEKDTLRLVDMISYTKLYSVSLNLDSVKLYQYDPNQENLCGNEISSTRYQIRYDSQAGKMTVVVPDQLACVLVYQYNYDKGKLADISNASISNSVKLMGESSKSDITKLQVNDSGASAHQNIEIYKVDSTDFTKKLSGAKFELEYWNNVNGTWSWTQIGEYVSGDGSNGTKLGEIELPLDKSGNKQPNTIWENYIYRLDEIEAPAGYAKRTEPYYFVRTKETDTNKWEGYGNLDSSVKDTINKISISGENIYIPNVASGVSVRKVWVNQDGSQISDPTGSIKVQLYKSTGKIDGANVTVKWKGDPVPSANKSYLVKRGSTVVLTTFIHYSDFNCSDPSVTKTIKTGSSNSNKIYIFSGITNDCELIGDAYYNQNNYKIDFTEASDVVSTSSKLIDEVTLDASKDWSHEWTNLEAEDNIYYYVKEVGDHSGYTVSYMNNGGIHSGEIVITNKVEEQPIVLPETGGTGTYWYTMGGVLLTAGAAFLIYKKNMQKGGKRIW